MENTALTVSIDWLEFTILNSQLHEVMKTMELKWDDFSKLSKGKFGYNNQIKWSDGSIFIMFTAKDEDVNESTLINPKSGVHVMITGKGCRQYSVNHDLISLIKRLYSLPRVNFSRIDLAIDDFESKIINYDRIHEAAINGHFTSRWSKWDEINSRQTSDNHFLGRTMYFGSQVSEIFCRIYDKTLERKAKSDETEIPKNWTRLEMVYRKERATKLVDFLINKNMPIGYVLRGTLKHYLRFILPSTDRNKARWRTTAWWEELLSSVDRLQLTVKKEARTIDDMTAWIDQQISPTLSAILKAQEGDLGWLRSILAKGSKRLTQKHKDAINQYLKGMAA